ncbi:MFS transporter [Streptomyces ginkgonis]|uniref:MFS transporter n=1 Tax=Streptomyces ginkgonis TaxID=1812259 RepID=UPI002176A08E|nr:MFS transporter [Streptomyces ginkgonis]
MLSTGGADRPERPDPPPEQRERAREPADPRRWWALAVIGLAQLLVVLDATVVNIALPSAQQDLGMTDAGRQWVVAAYTLPFGGLLLLGGRIADLAGRRRMFLLGLAGFGAASALGGAAPGPGALFAARALQGAFAALLAPAALSLLTTLFTSARDRARAFGVYGALSGGGAAAGLLAGGILTEYLDWRWCLYVNVPLVALALAGCALLRRDPPRPGGGRLDLPGTLLGCGGLLALVAAFAEAEGGWDRPVVAVLLVTGALALLAFTRVEWRAAHPLLPLRVVADRSRGGAFLAVGVPQVGLFGLFLFLTYYFQAVLGYSPVEAGLAFLPLSAAMGVGAAVIARRALARGVPARHLMAGALLVAAAGMVLLTGLEAGTGEVFAVRLLPAQLLIGAGIGCAVMPAMITASAGVDQRDAGVAAALVNSAQQIGGSLGIALLNTVATSVAAAHPAGGGAPAALVHGYTVALWVGVGFLLLAAVLAGVLVPSRRPPAPVEPGRQPAPL